VRWVTVGNIHLTLKFFGNVPDDEIDTLAQRPGKRRPRPLVAAKATGRRRLPVPTAPRWWWLGWGACAPLTQLFYRLEKAFAALAIPRKAGPSTAPHLGRGNPRPTG